MKKLMYSFLLFLSTTAHSEPTDWMKKENPKSLGLYVFALTECNFSNAYVEDRIEGEFLRAGIKPTKDTDLFINVEYTCLPQSNVSGHVRGHSVHMDIRFGTRHPNGSYVLYTGPMYGTLVHGGTGSDTTQFFINQLSERASIALTDFLRANIE
ncbi:hypothetical protein AB4525_08860 [Vibrio breoganii]